MGVAGNGCGNIPTTTRLTLELNSQYTPHSADDNTLNTANHNTYPWIEPTIYSASATLMPNTIHYENTDTVNNNTCPWIEPPIHPALHSADLAVLMFWILPIKSGALAWLNLQYTLLGESTLQILILILKSKDVGELQQEFLLLHLFVCLFVTWVAWLCELWVVFSCSDTVVMYNSMWILRHLVQ